MSVPPIKQPTIVELYRDYITAYTNTRDFYEKIPTIRYDLKKSGFASMPAISRKILDFVTVRYALPVWDLDEGQRIEITEAASTQILDSLISR